MSGNHKYIVPPADRNRPNNKTRLVITSLKDDVTKNLKRRVEVAAVHKGYGPTAGGFLFIKYFQIIPCNSHLKKNKSSIILFKIQRPC